MNPLKINLSGFKYGIGRKLIIYILLFSSLVTFLGVFLQLYLDYSHDVDSIRATLSQIKSSYLESVENSLWITDDEALRLQLQGIKRLPHMQYVEIKSNDEILFAAGSPQSANIIESSYPLAYLYKGKNIDLGTLKITASLTGIYDRLIDRIVIILTTQTVKTFLVSIFIFLLFYLLVGRHLATMASSAKNIGFERLNKPLSLDRPRKKTGHQDELDLLVESLNMMQENLKNSYAELKNTNLSLQNEINERSEAEKALLKSEERYRALFDNTPINTVVVDKEGKITAYKFPDEGSGEIQKPNIGDVMYIDYAKNSQIDMHKELMDSIESGRKKELFDLIYDDKFLHIRIFPYQDGAIITAIDTTPVRKLESELQQARKMESIGTLAGGIAHEFNNILGIIMGNAELAIDDIPDYNPALDCVKEIREASLRAKDVVLQIMSFARKTPADRAPMQIRPVIRESLKLLRSTIQKNIRISEKILCASEVILGNKTEINQILINLCRNSEQAMKEGIGEIEVSLEPVVLDNRSVSEYENLEAGKYVKLTVKDTGKGIAPEIMDRIFDPYFTTKDIGEGLGMGLAIVYGIMKKHEGHIEIKGELGKGTTVELLFPVLAAQPEEKINHPEILPSGTERIMFVDDEPSLVKVAIHMLEQQGYEVIGKTGSKEALELFKNEAEKFDLIITDMAMPDMPGDKLIKEILEIRSNIPIILSSGHSDRIDESMFRELGIMAYAMKPLNKVDLIKTVRNVLDGVRV